MRIVSSSSEVVRAFLGLEEINEAPDGVLQTVNSSFSGLTQRPLSLAKAFSMRLKSERYGGI